ncbi:putative transposase [Salinibacter ruber]|nr:putative transposase [Salinibacter ruber]
MAFSIQPAQLHNYRDTTPYQVIHRFKEKSAHVLRKEFDQLHRLPSLWTRSYFVSTTGKVSEEIVGRYIEDQS